MVSDTLKVPPPQLFRGVGGGAPSGVRGTDRGAGASTRPSSMMVEVSVRILSPCFRDFHVCMCLIFSLSFFNALWGREPKALRGQRPTPNVLEA